jgi:hypothetical protein
MPNPDPNKLKSHLSSLPNSDPVNKEWHRLFQFWESYDKEYNRLLETWHNETAEVRRPDPSGGYVSTGNVLYDSFLDTWGKDNFVDPKGLNAKSYFAALATASINPRDRCLETLKTILKTDANGNFTRPPEPKNTEEEANAVADGILKSLAKQYWEEFQILKKCDDKVKEIIGSTNDSYLEALIRMMDIETRCFERQAHFLDTGKLKHPAP